MDEPQEPTNLKVLRRLVTVLTVVMICGVLVVIGLLVTRLQSSGPDFPRTLDLPNGVTATAFTQGTGWYAIVTDENQILIFDQMTGKLRQTVQIEQ